MSRKLEITSHHKEVREVLGANSFATILCPMSFSSDNTDMLCHANCAWFKIETVIKYSQDPKTQCQQKSKVKMCFCGDKEIGEL